MEKLKELLDCMPGNDGSLPLKEIQKRVKEKEEREAIQAAMRKKYRKSLTRSSSGPLLPKIVVRNEEDIEPYEPGTFFRYCNCQGSYVILFFFNNSEIENKPLN